MLLRYEAKKLEDLTNDFYATTGVNFNLLNSDFEPLLYEMKTTNKYCALIHKTASGQKACSVSDRTLLTECKKRRCSTMHICHAGLVDIALPLMQNNEIIAYIILGQLKTEDDFWVIKNNYDLSYVDLNELDKFYSDLTLYDAKRINSISNLAIVLAKYILFENLLTPNYNPLLNNVLFFIDENLSSNISITDIATATNMSKSSLYKLFHTHLGCTISEYINLKRIDKSIELLKYSHLSITEISDTLGFSSPQYYSRIFKKHKGLSPNKYIKLASAEG